MSVSMRRSFALIAFTVVAAQATPLSPSGTKYFPPARSGSARRRPRSGWMPPS